MGVPDKVRELIEPALAARGTEVVDVQHGHGLLSVMIDQPGGVDLNVVAEVSEQISAILDEADPISSQYTLEVSSPGIERPLRTPQHFQRFIGSQVNVKTKEAVDGERRFTGTLESADDDHIVVDGREFSYGQIDRARLVVDWNEALENGGQNSDDGLVEAEGK